MADIPLVGRTEVLDALAGSFGRGKGALLVGGPGVGKSRLLEELIARVGDDRFHIERFVGSDAGRDIRFGALISVVDGRRSETESQQLAAIRGALLSRAAPRKLVLVVDDLHLLDGGSLACVADLVNHNHAIILAAVRIDIELPTTVTSLWTGAEVERVDVGPLDDATTATMVDSVLGGPADARLVEMVIARSNNNPQFVRELIRDGVGSGAIEERDGRWRLTSSLAVGERLLEIVRARTSRLTMAELEMLDAVAFGEPIDADALPDGGGAIIRRLERSGLVKTSLENQRIRVRCDQPVIGEAIRHASSEQDRHGILTRLLEGFERVGCPHPGDALRAAAWGSEIGVPVSAASLGKAAQEAIASGEFERARSLAQQAVERDEKSTYLVTLGDIHRLIGEPLAADAHFRRACVVARSQSDEARAIGRRALLHAHQLGRPDLAVQIAATGAQRITDPDLAIMLERIVADCSGMLGRYDEVLRSSERILQIDDGRRPARRRDALNNLVYAQVMLGQLDDIDERIDESHANEETAAGPSDWSEVLWALRTGVFIQRGELVRGESTLRRRVDNERPAQPVGLAATMHLQLLLYRASPAIFDVISATIAELRRTDAFGVMPIAAALAACAYAQTGDLPNTRSMLELLGDDPGSHRAQPFVARGQAAELALLGDAAGAADVVVEAGRAAIGATHVIFGITTLHDAVRFGRARDIADEMETATRLSTGHLTALMVAEAAATRDADGTTLLRIAHAYQACGAPLMAAETLSRAGAALEPDSTDARLAEVQHLLLANAVAPFLAPDVARPVHGLSAREVEIATAACTPMTSRQIAEAQFISVRTVDNHLRQVYQKLELSGRSELTAALGDFVST